MKYILNYTLTVLSCLSTDLCAGVQFKVVLVLLYLMARGFCHTHRQYPSWYYVEILPVKLIEWIVYKVSGYCARWIKGILSAFTELQSFGFFFLDHVFLWSCFINCSSLCICWKVWYKPHGLCCLYPWYHHKSFGWIFGPTVALSYWFGRHDRSFECRSGT